jgi:hypothetical protein
MKPPILVGPGYTNTVTVRFARSPIATSVASSSK